MNKTAKFFLSIGARGETQAAATTQLPTSGGEHKEAETNVVYLGTGKTRMLDRWLDKVVALSGSNAVLLFTVIALITWALLGIKFANRTGWQVGISDAQAIINMVFDAFLVRQQLNAYDETLVILCQLQSRAESHRRMLRALDVRQRGQHVPNTEVLVKICPPKMGFSHDSAGQHLRSWVTLALSLPTGSALASGLASAITVDGPAPGSSTSILLPLH
jgi:hypothetical protein